MTAQQIRSLALQSTIGLHEIGDDGKPRKTASGCLVKYLGRRYALTVQHAVGSGRWGIKLEVTPDMRQKYFVAQYTLITRGELNVGALKQETLDPWSLLGDPTEVDFAFSELPDACIAYDEFSDWDRKQRYSQPKHEFGSDLSAIPQSESTYAFFGETRALIDEHRRTITTTPKFVDQIRYLRTYEDFHVFRLPSVIDEPEELKGCSGAPIIDQNGLLVALVVGNYRHTNRLLGIRLDKYRIAIEVDAGVYG